MNEVTAGVHASPCLSHPQERLQHPSAPNPQTVHVLLNHVKRHVFRVKRVFVTGFGVFPSYSGWLYLYRFSCNHLFHYTYTFTSTYTINHLSTMSTQQQSSLKSITTDEVAKVSIFHALPYATI
jgi:hypothetical protein